MFCSFEFKTGEGLVGQAVLEKQSILITAVPEDYIAISSGLVETPPRNILVIPLVYNEKTLAVMELESAHTRVNDQTWLKHGMTQLDAFLRGEQSLEDICTRTLMPKPFSKDSLVKSVRKVLDTNGVG